ncbi:AAA family ATPase [Bhargavaea cecembensis]|uniref:AAA family ATPase n=1 Tax=Bhargavaea cecembensis TaxID=394098 RepID=UPI0006938D86|nr:AAA family ATPase [Bhargavaea cecembensis]
MDDQLTKLDDIISALNARFYEREEEIEAILTAVLARQHLLMIGPSGTAKSALVVELSKMISGTEYFQWLLTRFSTPEELFGPLSLKDLEHGVYKRNTKTKMPEADLAFLDEIFKANSAILNSLLTILNERLFYNDGSPVEVPLMSVIGASNEYPEEGEGLEALFDRFLLRFEVDYIEDDSNFISMMKNEGEPEQPPIMTMEDLAGLQELTDRVGIREDVYTAISKIRNDLQDEGIRPSDRRFKQSLGLLQARALLQKRETVIEDDLIILENSLWETPEQKDAVSAIVRRHARDETVRMLDSIRTEAHEVYEQAKQDRSEEFGLEASQKLKSLEADLKKLNTDETDRKSEVEALLQRVNAMQQETAQNTMYDDDSTTGPSGIFYRM